MTAELVTPVNSKERKIIHKSQDIDLAGIKTAWKGTGNNEEGSEMNRIWRSSPRSSRPVHTMANIWYNKHFNLNEWLLVCLFRLTQTLAIC